VAAVAALLSREHVRLLTLSGPGGTGKTRLGLQVAAELSDRFANGVFFVNLAPIRDPEFVLPAIGQVLGIKETSEQSPLDLLQASLREQQVLLLLDNFEQVMRAASHISVLLAACPKLKIMVTSRMVLHVRAEQEYAVLPLSLADPARLPDLVALAQYEAVTLFVARAQAIKADFALTEANARAIAEICVRLDGLPLAIELAAARSKLLPPQALLRRLSHRLEVLTGGAQDLPARQQTLRNTLQWSYDLLTKQEQRLFRWLSIFVGGCTLEAAEAVFQPDQADGDQQTSSVLEGVASLLDKSLVQQTEREGETPRFVMLETLHEFGWECLQGYGELEAAREAHARYYLGLAEQAEPELQGPNQATWLEHLEQEHDNLRAALEWALEEAAEQVPERREIALRMSVAMKPLWLSHGHYREARTFVERALASSERENTSLRARALRVAADLAIWRGDLAQTMMLSQQSLALYRELGDVRGTADSLLTLGRFAWRAGKTTEAIALSEEGVQLMRRVGQPGEVGFALFLLAVEISVHGEYSRGQAIFEEAVQLFRTAGNELMVGAALVQSAEWLWFTLGDAETIRQRLHEGQALINKVGNRQWVGEYSFAAALAALSEGETEKAYRLAQESLTIFQEIDARWFIAVSLHALGRVEVQRGDLRAARSSYQESLALTEALGEQVIASFDLVGLAGVAAAQGELRWAAQLWGAAEALREAIAVPLPPVDRTGYEQAVRGARAQLGESAFAAAWQEGRMMTPGQALAAQGQTTIPPSKPSPTYPSGLTAREVEVLRLVAQGLTNTQIAEQLTISLHTVNAHVRSIFNKLDVNSRNAVTRFAIEHKLI
jgi:predicted ATPase/DNA-binding CsgD family transcriptional regulator